jgi:hypothetical protein
MKADEALEQAVATWRTKHHIREDDPMLAALDLVRVYLAHAPLPARDGGEVPPATRSSARPWSCWTGAQTPLGSNRST